VSLPLEKLVIAVLIMSAFLLGISNFTGDISQGFSNVQNTTYFDKSGELSDNINDMQESLQSNQEETDILSSMLKGLSKIFQLLFDTLSIFTSLITSFFAALGLDEFANVFIGIVTIIIIFGIAYMILNMR
jgi:hypothetical protein